MKDKVFPSQEICLGSIVRPSISGCRPLDPGSNPGQGAIILKNNNFYLKLFTKTNIIINCHGDSFDLISTQVRCYQMALYELSVTGLEYKYEKIKAVDNISFNIQKGEIFSFLGPNGAGKTTTINILTTLLPIQKGKVSIS